MNNLAELLRQQGKYAEVDGYELASCSAYLTTLLDLDSLWFLCPELTNNSIPTEALACALLKHAGLDSRLDLENANLNGGFHL
jgi:hypothetical protein